MSSPPPDFLIIGAGPAGCAAAILLARRGLRVLVLDKARFPREKLCGEFLSPEGVASLDRLGLLPALRAAGAEPVTGTLVSAASGQFVTAPFEGLHGLPPEGMALRRLTMDALLVEAARRAGAEVIEGAHVEAPMIDEGPSASLPRQGSGQVATSRVVGALARRSPDGPIESFHATRVLAADGRMTRFARPTHEAIGHCCAFKSHFHGPPPLDHRVELHAFPGGYCGLVRVDGGRTNCCFLIDAAAARETRGDADALMRAHLFKNPLLQQRLGAAERCADWVATGPLDYAVREPVADGVLLLGDAAGIIDPFCGDGMAMALHSAEIAASLLTSGRAGPTGWEGPSGPDSEGIAGGSPLPHQGDRLGTFAERYRRCWRREFTRRLRVARWLRRALLTPWLTEALVAGLRPFPSGVRYLVRATRT